MDDIIAILERSLPAQDVIEKLAQEYNKRFPTQDFLQCEKHAVDSILPRLSSGLLDAWSGNFRIDSSIDTGILGDHEIISQWDFVWNEGQPKKVPREFWAHFENAGSSCRTFNPFTGDFTFSYFDNEFSQRDGFAFAVYFFHKGLPALSIPERKAGAQSTAAITSPKEQITLTNRGRRPANWWPDFAEELAVYIHNHGIPETQEALISGVQSALAEQGKLEPSRAQIQPVIRALFTRLTAAGN